ncbi:hypothetical protein LTR53_003943 [Teratosphaeriaceae sp. CCFEE 6253]|nr:hypothetical protein LTR53_003943 [Teratosphaeriaceae sp. CCFEE 6253]
MSLHGLLSGQSHGEEALAWTSAERALMMSIPSSGDQARAAALTWKLALPMLWKSTWDVATLADPYQHYDFTYGAQDRDQQDEEQTPVTSTAYQQLLTQGFQPQDQYLPTQVQQQSAQAYQQYGIGPILPSQVTAPEPSYAMGPSQIPTQMQRAMSTVSSSHYGTPQESPELLRYQPTASAVRKRSHQSDYSYDYQGLQQLQAHAGSSANIPVELTPHGRHAQLQSGAAASYYIPSQRASPQQSYPQQPFQTMQPQTHHHHRLPNQPPPAKSQRTGEASSATEDHGPPNMVGQAGMPGPAPKPKGPKLKFTAEDDALLVELKETKNLTWKQISDFFPGRSSGTLQVRYCTKLKAKTTVWTDEMAEKLRAAVDEYETDRWRIISGKVGSGFSAAACREKATEMALPGVAQDPTADAGEAPQETAHRPARSGATLASLPTIVTTNVAGAKRERTASGETEGA